MYCSKRSADFVQFLVLPSIEWKRSQIEVTQFVYALQSIHSCYGTNIIESYQELPQLQSKIKWNIFHSLRCNEVNFHKVRRLTVMTSLNKLIICDCGVFIPVSKRYENQKNRLRSARVVVENEVAFFPDTVYIHLYPRTWQNTYNNRHKIQRWQKRTMKLPTSHYQISQTELN